MLKMLKILSYKACLDTELQTADEEVEENDDDVDFSDEEAVNINDRPVSMVFTGPVQATLITVL